MPGIYTITADDTLTLFGRVFSEFSDGDTSTITFPNDLVTGKTGKNGNTIFAKDEKGNNATAILRVMRGGSDDRFLQSKLALINQDFAAFVLASGTFVKRLGDGQGAVASDVYLLAGGTFTRKVDGKENVNGDGEQGVAIYNMFFAAADRQIQ